MSYKHGIGGVICGMLLILCAGSQVMSQDEVKKNPPADVNQATNSDKAEQLETATFGSGCFWCTEAVFQQLRGVKSVVSGYSGGETADPTYEEVCSGRSGHAEVIQITFDPKQISYDDLLKVFWQTHDPTTLNRQGNDVGTQYRSAIFYHSGEQRKMAEQYKKQLDEANAFGRPIVTEITPFEKFYPAEKYHQKYFESNPTQGYCAVVIRPKVEKFRKDFAELLASPSKKPQETAP